MMNDHDLAPPRKRLPPTAPQPPATLGHPARVETGGTVRSALTGWLARSQARAIAHITARTRKETELLNAQAELAAAYEATARKVNRLRKLPEILALDDARFDAEQDAEYESVEERYVDDGHARTIRDHRRQKEVEDTGTEVVEAQRKRFTSAQGFENQRRLKGRNLRTWEIHAEALQLDAEAKAAKVRSQISNSGAADEVRRSAEQALAEALADGNDVEAHRWQRILDALDATDD
jgi:hypothetical protein